MIELTDLTKIYGHGDDRTVVLDRIGFRVESREILAVLLPAPLLIPRPRRHSRALWHLRP